MYERLTCTDCSMLKHEPRMELVDGILSVIHIPMCDMKELPIDDPESHVACIFFKRLEKKESKKVDCSMCGNLCVANQMVFDNDRSSFEWSKVFVCSKTGRMIKPCDLMRVCENYERLFGRYEVSFCIRRTIEIVARDKDDAYDKAMERFSGILNGNIEEVEVRKCARQ